MESRATGSSRNEKGAPKGASLIRSGESCQVLLRPRPAPLPVEDEPELIPPLEPVVPVAARLLVEPEPDSPLDPELPLMEPLPVDPEPEDEPMPDEPEPDEPRVPDVPPEPPYVPDDCWTRRLFCTCFAPATLSAMSSARRFASRLSTVPVSVISPPETLTSILEASTRQSSVRRSETSSRTRSSERE